MMTDLESDLSNRYPDLSVIRRLVSYLKPHAGKVALALFFLLSVSLLNLVGPYLTKVVIDDHVQTKNLNGLDVLAGVYLLSLLLSFVCQFMQHYMVQTLGQQVMSDLRMQVFQQIQKMSFAFYDKNPIGKLVTRVVNDVEVLNEMLTSGLILIFSDLFTLIGIWGILWYLNWHLMLVVSIVFPFLLWATHAYRVRAKDALRKNRSHVSSLNAMLEENLAGMTTVQLFNEEERRYRIFADKNEEKLKEDLRSLSYSALYLPSIDMFSALGLGLVIWYGGGRFLQDHVELGVLIAFLQYLSKFFEPVRDLAEKFNIIQTALASSERIFELLDTEEEIKQSLNPHVPEKPVQGAVEFDKVWFAYEKECFVLKNISFSLSPGESLAIVGATGSGKSTLVNTLLRFYDIQSGRIAIDGVPVERWEFKALRHQMAWVQQEVVLFSGSVLDNLRLAKPDLELERIQSIARSTYCHDFIDRLRDRYQTSLSGVASGDLSFGQRQLLSLARALAADPRILILDEATSGVDLETEFKIQQVMQKLIKNRTAIIIAHRLSTLKQVDKVLVLKRGEVVEFGTRSELLQSQGVYYHLLKDS